MGGSHSYGGDFITQAHHPFVLQTGKPILGTETYNLGEDFAKARYCSWQALALFTTELEWSSMYQICGAAADLPNCKSTQNSTMNVTGENACYACSASM